MKESLKLLGVECSGLQEISKGPFLPSDDEILQQTQEISSQSDKENYLRSILKDNPPRYVKSKQYLACIVGEKDPEFAYNTLLSSTLYSLLDPKNYLIFADIAIKHKAWKVAKSFLEVVPWLCKSGIHSNILNDYNKLNELVLQKLNFKEKDNSDDNFWFNKSIEKYWILEMLYYQSRKEELVDASFKLLNIFPKNVECYEAVFKALSLLDDKSLFNKFISYVEVNISTSNLNHDLLLGISYYALSDYEKSVQALSNVLKCDQLNRKALLYLGLSYLFRGDLKNFDLSIRRLIPLSEPIYLATYFIHCSIIEAKLDKTEYPNQKNISREIASLICKLINTNFMELALSLIHNFKKLDFFLILPYLPFFLAEAFIKASRFDLAKNILSESANKEVHRLMSWIYRLEGKEELAENELIKYRLNYKAGSSTWVINKLIGLNLPKVIPDKESIILDLVNDAYKQTEEIVKELTIEYGLNSMTCMETTCQDCCTKTFPFISFVEYLYLRTWLNKQPESLRNEIKENSISVINLYKEKFHRDPPFILRKDKDFYLLKIYPLDLVFNCPNLGDNKCNVYEARPFMCRAYSFGSLNGVRYKGCSYFLEQFHAATVLTNIRKVLDMTSFFDFAKCVDEKLIGGGVIAPIPVWFAQDHDETIKILKIFLSNNCD